VTAAGLGLLFVPGTPAPQGSTKAYVINGRARITADNQHTKPWRQQLSTFIAAHIGAGVIVYPTGPVGIRADFVMPRRATEPKRATPAHTRKPDSDKLGRCVGDSMTGLIYTDDAQVVAWHITKRTAQIGEQPGVHLSWWTPTPDPLD
jgi:crossover junction endodeoxyribonuclease RusA